MPPPPTVPSSPVFPLSESNSVSELGVPPGWEQQPTPQSVTRQFASTPRFILNRAKGKERRWPTPLHPSSPVRSQQFATPPRFISSSIRATVYEPELSKFSSPTTLPRSQKPVLREEPRDDIEEAYIDSRERKTEDGEDEDNEKGFPNPLDLDKHSSFNPSSSPIPKRRRLGPPKLPHPEPIVVSSSELPSSSSPPPTPPPRTTTLILTPPRPLPFPANQTRFLVPDPSPSTPPPPLPKFLLPAPPSPPPALPTILSPPRSSQKYVPNGLASTVRDMVVETALQASHLARLRARDVAEETWDFKIDVADARSDGLGQGIVLVREKEGKGWALIGKGRKGNEAEEGDEEKVQVQRGYEIGVRKPVWELELLGEKWVVGVEWEVLRTKEYFNT